MHEDFHTFRRGYSECMSSGECHLDGAVGWGAEYTLAGDHSKTRPQLSLGKHLIRHCVQLHQFTSERGGEGEQVSADSGGHCGCRSCASSRCWSCIIGCGGGLSAHGLFHFCFTCDLATQVHSVGIGACEGNNERGD